MFIVSGSNTPAIKRVVRRLAAPALSRFQALLVCGMTPRKLALTLCLGCAVGVLPLLWGTSLLCILLAHLLRLNQVALQSVNYLLYPLQLALLVPFYKLGAWLFPWSPPLPLQVFATLAAHPLDSWHLLGWITLQSLAAWVVTALPAALLLYGVMAALLSNHSQKYGQRGEVNLNT